MLLGIVLNVGMLIVLPGGAAHAAPLNDCVSSDNADPVVRSFARTPAVDVTAGPKRVFFRLRAADLGGPGPASGLSTVRVGLGGSPSLEGGDFSVPYADLKLSTAGEWVGSVVVPRWSRPGQVPLGLTLVDRAENYRFIEPSDLAGAGFPARVRVASTPDTTRPKLTSLRFTPGKIDARRHPRRLTITATATDSQSRVRSIGVNGQMGDQNLTRDPDGTITLTKVAGTVNKFRGTTRVSRWVGTGTWKVYGVWVEDHAQNIATYGYRRLGRLGFARDLKVASRVDNRRPTIRRLALSPTAVDVRAAGKRIAITLRAVDAQSGVQGVEASFWGPDGNGWGSTLHRVAGTRRNGVWRGVHTVARCTAQPGALRLTVDVTDGSGNTKTYRRAALEANGWPTRVTVRADDHSRPSAFAFSDSVPRTGPIRIEFSEHVNGITSSSIIVRRLFGKDFDFTNGPVVAGTWACRDGARAVANCATGRVLTARFTPTQPLVASAYYSVTPNPEFSLGVTDLAGNPVPREEILVQAAP